ncbi:MAG: hypothetical protein GX640_00520, partial [Fibrobacter sp.]|nr:hypothetical protein [Fibrobacter sp.]
DDYIQYSNFYFTTPTISLLKDDVHAYTNSLLFLYLNKFYGTKTGFITKMHLANYEEKQQFDENLNNTSRSFGKDWVELLNEFHTASYFTNSRADTGIFLSDAPKFSKWNYPVDQSNGSRATKTVNPYSMERFYIPSQDTGCDNLLITLQGNVHTSETGAKDWAASIILTTDSGPSIHPVTFNARGKGQFERSNFRNFKDAIVVATNGHPSSKRSLTFAYQFCPTTYNAGDTFKTTVTGSFESTANLRLVTSANLHCDLSTTINNNPDYLNDGSKKSLRAVSDLFKITYPLTWPEDSIEVTLTLSPTGQYADTKENLSIYFYDSLNNIWNSISTSLDQTSGNHYRCKINEPGTYGLFQSITQENFVNVYPNVTNFKNGYVYFRGTGIVIDEVRIFRADGTLVGKMNAKSVRVPFSTIGYQTYKLDISKCGLIPGVYFTIIQYHKNSETKIRTVRNKIMIVS